jgi:tRNA nucleotidyltransferase/poly(A) polymerase
MRRPLPREPDRSLSRLRRRGEVRALSKVVRALGLEAWLVGGSVRDACLGIADAEIDAAVSGDAEAVARALESAGAGRAVFLSRGRPGPRVYRVAGRRPLDVAELEGGSIEVDLRRRDFTVNAMAVSLADGAFQDPFGGLTDLARRRLHPVRAANLLDDPLRALRAARLLATHGLRPDRETLSAARAAAPKLPEVATERIAVELSRTLGSPRAADALAWSASAGILSAAVGVPLEARAARRLASCLRPLDDAGTARLPEVARRRLRLAALALSLGLDEPTARSWLYERRMGRREAEDAARLVELTEKLPTNEKPRDAWRWIVAAGPLLGDALHLLARLGGASTRRRRLISRLSRLARRRRPAVRVSGDEVMAWLGIPAGPRVGELLAELAIAAAAGEVKNRREARNWLTGQVQAASSAL